tara:strand:- start:112 stop:306 length:195 start_codon:yes stop_codon:yes gene_type:complete
MFRSYAEKSVKTYRNAHLSSKLQAALAENKSIGNAEMEKIVVRETPERAERLRDRVITVSTGGI